MIPQLLATLQGDPDASLTSSAAWTPAALLLLATLPAYALIALGVETARAEILAREVAAIPWPAFGTVALLYSLAFPVVALVMGTVFGHPGRVPGWVGLRHLAVFLLAWTLAALWGLSALGLPFEVANGALLASLLIVLALDIRLAQVAGGFGLGSAVLVASVVGTLGMTLLLAGLRFYLG